MLYNKFVPIETKKIIQWNKEDLEHIFNILTQKIVSIKSFEKSNQNFSSFSLLLEHLLAHGFNIKLRSMSDEMNRMIRANNDSTILFKTVSFHVRALTNFGIFNTGWDQFESFSLYIR